MGYEVICRVQLGRESAEGKALLETDFIQFRSDELRFKVPFQELSEVTAAGDFLELKFDGKRARIELGSKAAERWAAKILNPPGRMDKLGFKPGGAACLEGSFDAGFRREAAAHEAGLEEADLVFLAAGELADLAKIASMKKKMRTDAALWIVYPKGRQDIREIDVLNAGRAAGLKDVKVVRFSDMETALKFVVPLEAREKKRGAK
jgi:hypothetical protein